MGRVYIVKYRLWQNANEKEVEIFASNATEAYDRASYEAIPAIESAHAYSVWVDGVRLKNGAYRAFNTMEGKPY